MSSGRNTSPFPIAFHQPFKTIYAAARLSALLVLLPVWTLYYTVMPRPRQSWTLRESVNVKMLRWVMRIPCRCGMSLLRTDKTREVPDAELKETSFVWLPPVEDALIRGIAKDDLVKAVRIPGYVWPKGGKLGADDGLVGLWIHGGGYMMGNGKETFAEAVIAREIQRNSKITTILAVDFRLSKEACHPGPLLDALAAYAYLIRNAGVSPSRIVILGGCAGGHLSLMLTRYLYEEKVFPLPSAVMLFSPWVDMLIDKELELDPSLKRPNADVDFMAPDYLVNLRFLGHHPESLFNSPYMTANRAPPGSFTGYPKVFVSTGSAEVWRQEGEELVACLRRDGVPVTLDVQPDAAHDFWGFGKIVPSDRARENLAQHAYEWIEAIDQETKASGK